jgi:hypothetical protein
LALDCISEKIRPTSSEPEEAASLPGSVIIALDSLHSPRNEGAAAITAVETAYGKLSRLFHSSLLKFSLSTPEVIVCLMFYINLKNRIYKIQSIEQTSNFIYRHQSKAILVYSMNALANPHYDDFAARLHSSGRIKSTSFRSNTTLNFLNPDQAELSLRVMK